MAITTTLQPRYVFKMVAIAVVSLVLGVWGVYDYVVKIPAKARLHDRLVLCKEVKAALEEAGQARTVADMTAARVSVKAAQSSVAKAVQELFAANSDASSATAEESKARIEEALASIKENNEDQWLLVLMVFTSGLTEATTLNPGQAAKPEGFLVAFDSAEAAINNIGNVAKPRTFDRLTQWAFILCLPCVPYFLWLLMRAKKSVYRLDDEGALQSPAGTWASSEIADIEMDRWMAKSVASVVHTDGRRVKLDDYIYRDAHRIVGALASERYPELWDADARQIKAGEESSSDSAEGDAVVDEPVEAPVRD